MTAKIIPFPALPRSSETGNEILADMAGIGVETYRQWMSEISSVCVKPGNEAE